MTTAPPGLRQYASPPLLPVSDNTEKPYRYLFAWMLSTTRGILMGNHVMDLNGQPATADEWMQIRGEVARLNNIATAVTITWSQLIAGPATDGDAVSR